MFSRVKSTTILISDVGAKSTSWMLIYLKQSTTHRFYMYSSSTNANIIGYILFVSAIRLYFTFRTHPIMQIINTVQSVALLFIQKLQWKHSQLFYCHIITTNDNRFLIKQLCAHSYFIKTLSNKYYKIYVYCSKVLRGFILKILNACARNLTSK